MESFVRGIERSAPPNQFGVHLLVSTLVPSNSSSNRYPDAGAAAGAGAGVAVVVVWVVVVAGAVGAGVVVVGVAAVGVVLAGVVGVGDGGAERRERSRSVSYR